MEDEFFDQLLLLMMMMMMMVDADDDDDDDGTQGLGVRGGGGAVRVGRVFVRGEEGLLLSGGTTAEGRRVLSFDHGGEHDTRDEPSDNGKEDPGLVEHDQEHQDVGQEHLEAKEDRRGHVKPKQRSPMPCRRWCG